MPPKGTKKGTAATASKMNRYNKAQKDKIGNFRAITGASEKIAIDCLKVSNWGVEAGIDYFYSSGISSTVSSIDPRAIENMFNKYKDKDGDTITGEGIMRLCSDLGVEPADVVMLVIAFYMNAATMGEFTKDEWSSGLLKLSCDTLDKLKKKMPELRNELSVEDKFRDVYNYAYGFSCEKGQKCVQLETASGMWQLLLGSVRPWALIDEWLEFLNKHHNRAISKDTWSQLYDFIKTVKPDFSNFDENSAWPYLIDEFVEHVRSSKA